MNSWQNEQNLINWYQIVLFFYTFSFRWRTHYVLIYLVLIKKNNYVAFACYRNYFRQKVFFKTEFVFYDINLLLWRKLFSLTETFFEGRIFYVKEFFFSDKNFFLCQKLVLSKIPFLGILYQISREKLPWEMRVSIILDNPDNHFVEPCLCVCPHRNFETEWNGDFWLKRVFLTLYHEELTKGYWKKGFISLTGT